jgi:stage II sporulation protein D
VSAEDTNADNSCINIDGKPYRDSIIVKVYDTDKLIVINETGLESYLCGILPHEIDPKWLMEALKAQAVVSRTFAMRNLESRHSGTGYNFCDEVHCQVYGGTKGEDERSNTAVDLTKGEVLTYKGNLVNTVYHACCGGNTESSKHVWLSKYKQPVSLSGRTCGFCKDSPHYRWSQTVEEKSIRKKLIKAGHGIGKITSIIPYGRTKSGRMKWVKIKYKKKNGRTTNKTLTSAQLRMIVSPWTIKSTKSLSVTKKGDNFKFIGRGWGHGVGMCQWGSKGMAESRYSYKRILKHYYRKTKIEKWAY